METAALRATGLRKSFGDHVVLDDIDLVVGHGELIAVVGPNGAGKSTLLECVAGAQRLDAGTIELDGRSSNPSSATHWRRVYGVLDDFAWLHDLTVRDHLALLGRRGTAADASEGLVERALDDMGIANLGGRLPESLSSGQRQRAALASCLVRQWDVLLLDEPERHLDAEAIDAFADLVVHLTAGGRAVVLSSHSSRLVERSGARTLDLGRAGRR